MWTDTKCGTEKVTQKGRNLQSTLIVPIVKFQISMPVKNKEIGNIFPVGGDTGLLY